MFQLVSSIFSVAILFEMNNLQIHFARNEYTVDFTGIDTMNKRTVRFRVDVNPELIVFANEHQIG